MFAIQGHALLTDLEIRNSSAIFGESLVLLNFETFKEKMAGRVFSFSREAFLKSPIQRLVGVRESVCCMK